MGRETQLKLKVICHNQDSLSSRLIARFVPRGIKVRTIQSSDYIPLNEGVRERLRLTIVLQDEEVVCEEDGDVRDNGEDPGEKNQPPHVPHSPGGQGADRMNDCQVPASLSTSTQTEDNN